MDIGKGSDSQLVTVLSSVSNGLVLIATLLLVPVAAQVFVALYLVRLFGWTWFDVAYIAFVVLNTLANCFAFLLVSRRNSLGHK